MDAGSEPAAHPVGPAPATEALHAHPAHRLFGVATQVLSMPDIIAARR